MERMTLDGKVTYEDQGKGEPALLCLPGWCVDRSLFDALTSITSRSRRTLSMDWRGHGRSAPHDADFGIRELVEDAVAVIEASHAEQVVPVALSHAGWVAIELHRRLGERVPGIIFVDWLVATPPPAFFDSVRGLQDPENFEDARDALRDMWVQGISNQQSLRLVRQMTGSYTYEMWARAGREILAAYKREGSPLEALSRLRVLTPALHLCAQTGDLASMRAQEEFAESHLWYSARKLKARSHFPMLEVPGDMAMAIESFMTANVLTHA